MTIKRDARGTLRDYSRESEGEFLSILFGLFKGLEVFGMTFSATSVLEPDGNFPRGSFPPFDKAYSTHPAFSIATTERLGVVAIFFWGNKTKILFSVIEPISVDMVDKCPMVFRLPYDVVVDKVISKPGIAVITFVKLHSNELGFIYVSIEDCISCQIVSDVIQWYFDCIAFKHSIIKYPVLVNGRQSCFASAFPPIVMKPAKPLSKMRPVASLDNTFHIYIMSKNNKISRIRGING